MQYAMQMLTDEKCKKMRYLLGNNRFPYHIAQVTSQKGALKYMEK
jgi:hypothetical protein